MRWLSPPTALVAVHLSANVIWIGAILSVCLLVAGAPFMADPADVGVLARRAYVRLATPAFLLSFVAGAARIALTPGAYLPMPWMHVKLGCALGVIGLHHAIGGKARRLAAGQVRAARGAGVLGFVLFVLATAAVFLAVERTLP